MNCKSILLIITTLLSLHCCLHFEEVFTEVSVVVPVDLDYYNSNIYTTSLNGQITVFPEAGDAPASIFFDISLSTSASVSFYTTLYEGGEDGMASFEFHPHYPSIPKFYTFYSASPTEIQVTAWNVKNGEVDYHSADILFSIPKALGYPIARLGGDLLFDTRGDLYISVGDGANQTASQDLSNLLGKVLRITPSAYGRGYTIPSSNPFPIDSNDRSKGKSEVFSVGYRNPRKILFADDKLIVSDVSNIYDEINVVSVGDNNGWDFFDGCVQDDPSSVSRNYKSPTYQNTADYDHAVTLGVYFGRTHEKSELSRLQNQIIFADLYSGTVYSLSLANLKRTCASASFVAQATTVSCMLLVNENLYYADPFAAFYGGATFYKLVSN